MSEDTIQLLETAARPRKEMSVLISSARESFRLIEPWSYARSDHKETTSLVRRVQGQVNEYYTALDSSIDVAQQGHTFACDCYDLCEFLLDPGNSAQDLIDYINDMREKAQSAFEAAKETTEKFRRVRQGLNEITGDIPAAVLRVQKDEEQLRVAQRSAQKRAVAAELLSGTLIAAGGALTGAAIAGLIVLPGAVVFLPVALPLMALAAKISSDNHKIVAQERGTQAKTCVDAMDQLRKSAQDLSELTSQMDNFADWWQDMDTMLGTLVSRISQLRADRLASLRLRVKSIQNGWRDVRDQYLDYKSNISKLQDYYPSSRVSAIEN